jgi:hypothetical protein
MWNNMAAAQSLNLVFSLMAVTYLKILYGLLSYKSTDPIWPQPLGLASFLATFKIMVLSMLYTKVKFTPEDDSVKINWSK